MFKRRQYQIPRPEASDSFLRARQVAGNLFQSKFEALAGRYEPALDYRWVKPELTSPSFDHLTFGYRNQIFSVFIKTEPEEQSPRMRGDWALFEKQTVRNNLVPCLFQIRVPELAPVNPGWNLTHALTGEAVDPEDWGTDARVKMSPWELRNFAIQVVSGQLADDGWKRLSFCDVPDIDPQLWVEDDGGNRAWVIVRFFPVLDDEEWRNWLGLETTNPMLRDFDGYFAGVSAASSSAVLRDENDEVIPLSQRFTGEAPVYRGDKFYIKTTGLKRVYVSP